MQDIIDKMQKLKSYSRRVTENISECKTLKNLHPFHVGTTGLTRQDIYDKVEKAKSCCDIVEIKEFIPQDGGESQFKISNANYCNIPSMCPICGTTKQSKQRRGLADGIAAACEEYPYVYMLTFTVAPDKNLNRQMNHLKKSFRRWAKLGQKRNVYKTTQGNRTLIREYYDGGQYGLVRAGFLSYEIIRGEGSGQWHVHAHALVWTVERLEYSYFDQDKKKALVKFYDVKNIHELPDRITAQAVEPDKWITFNGKRVPAAKMKQERYNCTGNSIHLDVRLVGYKDGATMMFKEKDKKKSRLAGKNIYRSKYVKNPAEYFKGIFKSSYEILTYYSKLLENAADDAILIMDETHYFKFFSAFRDMRKTKSEPEERAAAAIWSLRHDQGEYSAPRKERAEIIRNLNDIMKKGFLERAAIIQGEYRRRRNIILKENRQARFLSIWLDDTRRAFKTQMKVLWSHYTRARLTGTMHEADLAREAAARARELAEVGVQVSFAV